MAIFIPGMKCPLCKNPITAEEGRRLFPPFVTDPRDPLFVFHDATVHEACFARHPLSKDVERATTSARGRPSGE